jgi:hypothetical protein
MTKISKIMLAAGALGVLGVTALPVASYADVNTVLTVTVLASSDTSGATGGNNGAGYTWNVKDTDGTKLNMGTTDATGTDTGGIVPAATASAYAANGTSAQYGLKFELVPVASGPSVINTNAGYIAITGSNQKIGETNTGGSIQGWPTALSISPVAGTHYGNDTQGSSKVYLTAQWSTTLAAGVYKNTITISQAAK